MNRKIKFSIATAGILLVSAPAWSLTYDGAVQWSWPLGIVIPLVITAALYAMGSRRIAHSARTYRLFPTICFTLGWLALVVALDSPIHEIGEKLFWVHMTQHEILMLIAAPLIALGQPLVVFLHALPSGWAQRVTWIGHFRVIRKLASTFTDPPVTWLVSAAALWIWHLPALFDRAVEFDWVHAAQHTTFFLSALLFWWPLCGRKPNMGYGAGVLYVFSTALHTSVLGALLTFAPRAWYHPYLATAPAWHITALEDQQLGGLIMWVPAGTLLLIVALFLLVRWLNESQTRWQYTAIAGLGRSSQGTAQ